MPKESVFLKKLYQQNNKLNLKRVKKSPTI